MDFLSISPLSKRAWHVGHNAIRFSSLCSLHFVQATMWAISTGICRQVGIAHRWPASMSTDLCNSEGIGGRLANVFTIRGQGLRLSSFKLPQIGRLRESRVADCSRPTMWFTPRVEPSLPSRGRVLLLTPGLAYCF